MLRRILFSCVTIVFFASLAKADVVVVDITKTSTHRMPVAVPHFITESGALAGPVGAKIQALIIKDLRLTGMYDVWDDERLPRSDYDLVNLDFTQWKAVDVQVLVKGVVTKDNNVSVVQLRLYDVSDGRMLLGKQYALDGDVVVDVTHRFVDSLMKALTGTRGPFESMIAASCGKPNKENIFGFQMDDAKRTRYTSSARNNDSPAWSFDGTRLAYMSRLKNGETHINVTGAGGGGTQITSYKGFQGNNITPTWTPDGNLVFASARSDDMELYLVSPTGRILSQLTRSFNGDLSPAVSQDNQMVFVSERAGQVHLFRQPLGGGGASRLTYVGSQNEQPDWSPDGQRIAFSSGGGYVQDIFVMQSDGSNIVRLTEGEGNNASPNWSPDGRYIVFNSSRGGLYIMRDDGTNQVMIEKTTGCKNADWGPWLSKE